MEAANTWDLAGNTATLSFWVFSGTTQKDLTTTFAYPTVQDTFNSMTPFGSKTATIPQEVWTKVVVPVNMPRAAITGLQITIAAPNLLNGEYLYFSQLQFEAGSIPTQFERVGVQQQLANCQWYFERKNYQSGALVGTGQCVSTTLALVGLSYNTKRVPPSISTVGTFSATLANGSTAGGTIAFGNISESTARIEATATGIVAGNATCVYGATAGSITLNSRL
jgi:hypothetical protein